MKWIKASERLPESRGKENSVIIRGENLPKDQFGHGISGKFVTMGFVNFSKDNPQFYFLYGVDSYLSNKNIEWLDESEQSEPLPDSRFTWGNIEQAYIIGVINNGRSLIENFPQEVENHKKQLELLKKWFKDNVAAASTVSEAGEDAIGFADFIESNEFFKLENGLWDSSSIYPMSAALNLTTEQLYQLYKQSKQ